MDFISNGTVQIQQMLQTLGIASVQQLFQSIPQQLLVEKPLADDGMSEYEGKLHMQQIAGRNRFQDCASYLGAGAYEHHLPALVEAVCSKSEFLTAYTPYQAEASQGMLQSIFEFQSVICALTGMNLANASLYDGATACAEALLMAMRLCSGKNKVLISSALHPHYRGVVENYLEAHQLQIVWLPLRANGALDIENSLPLIEAESAALLLQSPNFFGLMEECEPLFAKAKQLGVLSILCANPLAYGIYASAGELGADIAVGDAQPFGIPLQFGGPYAGYIACRASLMRQMPGRIVGETLDAEGRRGYVLTLQAREQQIRREKATSNICTNQALAALAALVALLWYGKEGVKALALTNFQRASYLRARLGELGALHLDSGPIFNEFVVQFPADLKHVTAHFRSHGIEPGVDLGRYYPEKSGCLLIAVTETKSQALLDRYVQVASKLKL
jgi:glycine dehydrogenase subunit 1